MEHLFGLLYSLAFACGVCTGSSEGSLVSVAQQKIIFELLESDKGSAYDWRVRPTAELMADGKQGPVIITVNMYLRTISKVDDVNMEYSLHFTFREEWVDERLIFNHAKIPYINLAPGQKIWMPDTFFQNEKDGKKHDIDTPNVLLRIYNGTGRILYSVRMTLTLSCPMQLHNYPMDIQNCFCDFASYAYTTHDIEYIWKSTGDPVQIKKGLRQSLPSFTLSQVSTGNCTSVTNTGAYSCLRTILVLKREFSYYLLQLYIPSFMLVAVSWVSFWLDKDSVPARVTLGVTTLLTMTTQASGINAKLPPVSYTKAIDVWIGVCLAFIFGALLEFALINYAARKDLMKENKKRKILEQQQRQNTMLPNVETGMAELARDERIYYAQVYRHKSFLARMWHVKYRANAKRIDVLSRLIFPITFFIFNAAYWSMYLRPYVAVDVVME